MKILAEVRVRVTCISETVFEAAWGRGCATMIDLADDDESYVIVRLGESLRVQGAGERTLGTQGRVVGLERNIASS